MSHKDDAQPRETLDAETLAALDAGIMLAENGQRWTVEEAFEIARKRRKAWMKVQTDQLTA